MKAFDKSVVLIVHNRMDVLHAVGSAIQKKEPRVHLTSAESAATALQRLGLGPVQVFVTAPELPDMSGLDLIRKVRRTEPDLKIFGLLENTEVAEISAEFDQAEVPWVVRTEELDDLISRIRESCFAEEEVGEGVPQMSLLESVEWLCTHKAKAQIDVISDKHGTGVVVVDDGELVHALTEEGAKGEEALRVMKNWTDASLDVMYIMRAGKKTIYRPYDQVLHDITGMVVAPRREEVVEASADDVASAEEAAPAAQAEEIWRKLLTPWDKRPASHRIFWMFLLSVCVLCAGVAVGLFIFSEPERVPPGLREWLAGVLAVEEEAPPPDTEVIYRPRPKKDEEGKDIQEGPGPDFVQRMAEMSAEDPARPWRVCDVRIGWLPEFSDSGSMVVVSRDAFEEMGLEENPYIELFSPQAGRIGARAFVKKTPHPNTVYIRESMVRALKMNPNFAVAVALRPLQWTQPLDVPAELVFETARPLPAQYCEHWFAVGVALSVFEELGVKPGAYALVRGPNGLQSAQLQLMDRGERTEIWLSKPVKEAIGVTYMEDAVTMYPKHTEETPVRR